METYILRKLRNKFRTHKIQHQEETVWQIHWNKFSMPAQETFRAPQAELRPSKISQKIQNMEIFPKFEKKRNLSLFVPRKLLFSLFEHCMCTLSEFQFLFVFLRNFPILPVEHIKRVCDTFYVFLITQRERVN